MTVTPAGGSPWRIDGAGQGRWKWQAVPHPRGKPSAKTPAPTVEWMASGVDRMAYLDPLGEPRHRATGPPGRGRLKHVCVEHATGLPETTITITATPGPHGTWVDIGAAAQSADKYHVKCKHHECPGPHGLADTYIHVHGQAAVRPEVQDAVRVLLAELYASDAPGDTCPDAEDEQVRGIWASPAITPPPRGAMSKT